MTIRSEHAVFAAFVGKIVDSEKVRLLRGRAECSTEAYSDCNAVLLSPSCDWNKHVRLPFKLYRKWSARQIDFRIRIYVKNGKLVGGNVFKYQYLSPKGSRGYETTPALGEIWFANRVLKFLTKESDGYENH